MLFLTADPPKKIEIYENFQQKAIDYFGDILKSENLNFGKYFEVEKTTIALNRIKN
jgi:hypothetical protein